jgi:hypothetical protein
VLVEAFRARALLALLIIAFVSERDDIARQRDDPLEGLAWRFADSTAAAVVADEGANRGSFRVTEGPLDDLHGRVCAGQKGWAPRGSNPEPAD